MKKKIVIIGIIALLLCVGLSGCNQISNTLNPERNKFIGIWKESNSLSHVTFFPNGSCSFGDSDLSWDIKDGHLLTADPTQTIQITYTYSFSNNDKTLTLSAPGFTQILTKQ